jgi:hypothetical protein
MCSQLYEKESRRFCQVQGRELMITLHAWSVDPIHGFPEVAKLDSAGELCTGPFYVIRHQRTRSVLSIIRLPRHAIIVGDGFDV